MAKCTVIEDWNNGVKWTYVITPAYRFLWKRAARQAWKPRSCKSRWQKRHDRHNRRRYDQQRWVASPMESIGFERLTFKGVPIVNVKE